MFSNRLKGKTCFAVKPDFFIIHYLSFVINFIRKHYEIENNRVVLLEIGFFC